MGPMEIADDLAPTGTLRASINLGNPVLAQGTPEAPSGVTVDLARELGARLGVPVELVCFGAAKDSLAALQEDRADVCFLAVDPARAETVAFTAPYAVIEGVYAARDALVRHRRRRRPPRRAHRREAGLGVRPVPHPHAAARRGGPRQRGHRGVRRAAARRRGRDPAAGDRLRRHRAGAAGARAALHGDPAGGRHHPGPQRGDRRVPAGVRRGAQGRRVRRRGAAALGADRRRRGAAGRLERTTPGVTREG